MDIIKFYYNQIEIDELKLNNNVFKVEKINLNERNKK